MSFFSDPQRWLLCTFRRVAFRISFTAFLALIAYVQSPLHWPPHNPNSISGIWSRSDLSLRWITYWMLRECPWVSSNYSCRQKCNWMGRKEQGIELRNSNSGIFVRNSYQGYLNTNIWSLWLNFLNFNSHGLPTELSKANKNVKFILNHTAQVLKLLFSNISKLFLEDIHKLYHKTTLFI